MNADDLYELLPEEFTLADAKNEATDHSLVATREHVRFWVRQLLREDRIEKIPRTSSSVMRYRKVDH